MEVSEMIDLETHEGMEHPLPRRYIINDPPPRNWNSEEELVPDPYPDA